MHGKRGRIELYLSTGQAACKHHGTHGEWSVLHKTDRKHKCPYKYDTLVCQVCNRERTAAFHDKNPTAQDDYRFTRHGMITRILAQAGGRAKRKRLPFELDRDWVEEQAKRQDNKCAYSGLEFDWNRSSGNQKRYFLPSIDQRQAGMGYTKDNSVLVCWAINNMKWELPLPDFTQLCYAVASQQIGI